MKDKMEKDELKFIKQGLSILEQQNQQNQMVLTALAGYIEGIEAGDGVRCGVQKIDYTNSEE